MPSPKAYPRKTPTMRTPQYLAFALALATLGLGCSSNDTSTTASGTGGSGGAHSASSSSSGSGGGGGQAPWRSVLYPEDWAPGFADAEGRAVADFSYAGYHLGEADPKAPDGAPALDAVAGYGADPLGDTDATAALQQAIDDAAAAGGAVVSLAEGLYRVDGLLVVQGSGVVLRGAGSSKTKLYFTKADGMSDTAHLTFLGQPTTTLEAALAEDAAPFDTSIAVVSAAGLAPGDDVDVGFVVSPEFIDEHGMTGTWSAFNDTWQTFFRRTVVSVDTASSPERITLDVPIRYAVKLRDQASVRKVTGLLREGGIEGLSVSNAVAWDDAWTSDRAHAVALVNVKDAWIRDVSSFSSPIAPTAGKGAGAHLLSGGVLVKASKRVTVADSHMGLAENRGGGGNGYLFEIMQSSEVLIRDSTGDGGRHNFIQNWGFGTTGCVWLRVKSADGKTMTSKDDTITLTGLSELHHSLATANLVDSSTFEDGFSAVNRGLESTGAGHTGTLNVFWNVDGTGTLRSLQFGWGFVIGTRDLFVITESPLPIGLATEPIDWVEGLDKGGSLAPSSLYEDQLQKRLLAP